MKNHAFLPAARMFALLSATLMSGAPLAAQSFDFLAPMLEGGSSDRKGPPVSLNAEYSYTGRSHPEYRGKEYPKSAASSATFSLGTMLPLGEWGEGAPPEWLMPLGVTSQNLFFDDVPGVPIPSSAHTLSLSTGLVHRQSESWWLAGLITLRQYRLNEFGSQNFGVSGGALAVWKQSPEFLWIFGAMVNPDSDLPVIPVVGLDWKINPEFSLSLIVPRPRLTYRPNEVWSFHVGGNLNIATFRNSGSFGDGLGNSKYNRSLATYRDIRLGAGFEVRPSRHFSLWAEGGYSVDRRIDYRRVDTRVKFDPAPYVLVGLRVTM